MCFADDSILESPPLASRPDDSKLPPWAIGGISAGSVASFILFMLIIYYGKKRGLFSKLRFRAGANNIVEIEMNNQPTSMLEQVIGGDQHAFAVAPIEENTPDKHGMVNISLD